jgi:hypothetical protein
VESYLNALTPSSAISSSLDLPSSAMFFKRILYYLNPATLFGKSNPNVNLRFMHGINRISVFMFLICIVVMVVRACLR